MTYKAIEDLGRPNGMVLKVVIKSQCFKFVQLAGPESDKGGEGHRKAFDKVLINNLSIIMCIPVIFLSWEHFLIFN